MGDSGGNFNDSPTNYPLVALQAVNGGGLQWLALRSFTATTAQVQVPVGLPAGHYFLWVFVSGISGSKLVLLDTPPTADAQAVATDEEVPRALTLMGHDVEGAPVSYRVETQPTHGTLTGTPPNLTYTPPADYNGSDSFTFTVNDGALDSPPATVMLTVTPVNDAPVATSQELTVGKEPTVLTLGATDVDGDALTYAVTQGPEEGTLTSTPPDVTFTPPSGFRGPSPSRPATDSSRRHRPPSASPAPAPAPLSCPPVAPVAAPPPPRPWRRSRSSASRCGVGGLARRRRPDWYDRQTGSQSAAGGARPYPGLTGKPPVGSPPRGAALTGAHGLPVRSSSSR